MAGEHPDRRIRQRQQQNTSRLLPKQPFGCLLERRAIVAADERTTHKLIHVDGEADELFDLAADPLELADIRGERPSLAAILDTRLNQMAAAAAMQRDHHTEEAPLEDDGDAQLQRRLRGLGYLD